MSGRSDSQPRVLLVDDNPAFVEKLAEILQGQGYAVESAGTCGSALERTILEDFMQFARPTQFVSQPVDLQAVARKVYSLLKHDADQRGIRFECTSSERTRVLGHEERLRQVIINLALNALDAAPAGGWVRLICDEVEGEVAFSIEDSGPGIQPEVR